MMRVLFDTNVVLDVLLQREPWVSEASGLWQANDEGRITGYMQSIGCCRCFLHCSPASWFGNGATGHPDLSLRV